MGHKHAMVDCRRVVVAMIAASIKFVRWTSRVDTRLDGVDKRLDGVDKRLDTLTDTVQKGFANVRAEIASICGQTPASTLARGSPIRLSDLGKQVSERINAKALAQTLVPALRDQADDKSSAYDVQELCFAYVKEEWPIPAETDIEIRSCAFENGLKRDQVLDVVAVELRDLLLPPS